MDRLPDTDGKDPQSAMAAIAQRSTLLEQCKKDVLDVLKGTVRPEFLNRIDEVIMFEPLGKADIRDILHIQERELSDRLSEDGVRIEFTEAFDDYMTDAGYDPAYGARPVKRILQRELVNRLATAILDGSVHKDSAIVVDMSAGEVVLRNR